MRGKREKGFSGGGKELRLLLMKAGLALAALAAAALYFRIKFLLLAAAVLVYRLTLPLLMSQRKSRQGRRLRKEAVLWLEELTLGLKAGKALAAATRDLARHILASRGKVISDGQAAAAWRQCLGLLELNYPVDLAYKELALGLDIAEFRALAAVLASAVKTGASLSQVFIQCTAAIREQLEGWEALEARLAARRLEGCFLAAAPAVYTAFLRLVTPAYMAPLYSGLGPVITTVVFGLQIAGSFLFFHLLLREEGPAAELMLADFQEEMALQLSAGLSLPEAWQQAAGSRRSAALLTETEGMTGGVDSLLIAVAGQLAVGVPFAAALEGVRFREGMELRRLIELLLQNYGLGSSSLAAMLRLEAKESRQRCLLSQKARDSRRETWLLFPMILLLVSSLLLTAAPALLSL